MKTKDRWRKAGEMQDFYNSTYGTNYSKREFYKNENPLTRQLIRYDVTYSMDMKGHNDKLGDYEFYIPQDTYSIYVLNDVENEHYISETTKGGVADIFRGKSKTQVYNNTEVKVVRGVESNKARYQDINVKEIERDVNSNRVKKKVNVYSKHGGGSKNKNTYDLNIYINNNSM